MRRRSAVALLATLVLPFAACGDDSGTAGTAATTPSTTVPATAHEVVRYETIGGCQELGPNCPTVVIGSDGTVEVYRTGQPGSPAITGSLPAEVVGAFVTMAGSVDFEALAARVGPGSCQSCVDGTDVVLTLTLPSGEVQLDSTVVEFDDDEPFFAALDDLLAAAEDATGRLPILEG